jgi:tellurite resistance protein TerC
MNITNTWMWLGFSLFIIASLSTDAFLLTNQSARPHTSIRAACYWSMLWVATALIFNSFLWLYLYWTSNIVVANTKSMEFFTGYLIEKSLSIDNLFAFYVVFEQLQIPITHQQRVFSYGIWSAIILRLILILLGVWLITAFHWVLYVMGSFLLISGVKMLFTPHTKNQLEKNSIVCWLQHHLRITSTLHENKFFIRKNGLLYATPLLLALILIEISDIIFAFDSIPAIFGITRDPFIVWTSNIFAILGLRALYFLLIRAIQRFYLLKYSVACILVFIGSKMLLEPWLHLTALASLSIIIFILLGSIVMSNLLRK